MGIVARREAWYRPQYAESKATHGNSEENRLPRLPNTSLNDRPGNHKSKIKQLMQCQKACPPTNSEIERVEKNAPRMCQSVSFVDGSVRPMYVVVNDRDEVSEVHSVSQSAGHISFPSQASNSFFEHPKSRSWHHSYPRDRRRRH